MPTKTVLQRILGKIIQTEEKDKHTQEATKENTQYQDSYSKRSKKIPQTNIKIRTIITLNINALNSSNKRTQTSRLDQKTAFIFLLTLSNTSHCQRQISPQCKKMEKVFQVNRTENKAYITILISDTIAFISKLV